MKANEITGARTAVRNIAVEEVLKLLDAEIRKHYVQKFVAYPLAATVVAKADDTVKHVCDALRTDGWVVDVAMGPDGNHVYFIALKK